MNQYYLMAQLPSLDNLSDTAPLPITEERFTELCHRFLGKRARAVLDALTTQPAREAQAVTSPLVAAWNAAERQLRLALGTVRAAKWEKPFDSGDEPLPETLLQAARTAVEIHDPMEAERFLNRLRLEQLEALRPADTFCEDAVFYYGLRLKLLLRIRQFDAAAGQQAYQTIYDSILHADEQEAEQ